MKKILILILALTMVCVLTACTMPAMTNPDGTDTIAGVAIKNGLNILEAACVTALSIAAAVWAKRGGNRKTFRISSSRSAPSLKWQGSPSAN